MKTEIRNCQNCHSDFEIDTEDFNFYEKIKVPPPTLCWKCRLPRLLVWRNERALYKRPCDSCKKEIIAMYKLGTQFPVYCRDCWWSDTWDPIEYGKEYDFSKSFFEQIAELQKVVPRPALYEAENLNSEYCNFTAHNKNCYLMFGSWFSENCGYGQTVLESKDCWDCLFIKNCEMCLYSIDCVKCYQTHFSQNCEACSDSAFLYDCRNCQNCLFSYNLRNRSYHIFNKPVAKEEFLRVRNEVFASYSTLQNKLGEFRKLTREKAIHKYLTGAHNQNVSGNFINNSKNVHNSFFIHDGENEKYAVRGGKGQKDSMDVFGVHGGELAYESMNIDFCSRCSFGVNGENNVDTEYLIDCFTTENSLGCISLRHKKYCVLNKQYDEEGYRKIRQQIIAHMKERTYTDRRERVYSYGEFFPIELSPFGYNETLAQEYAPVTKVRADDLGYPWYDIPEKEYTITKRWNELPDVSSGIDEMILKDIILCEAWDKNKESAKEHKCTKAFRITTNELAMYRKFGMPLPRKCPNTRNFEASKLRNPVALWERSCACAGKKSEHGGYENTVQHFHGESKCPNEFETSYAPERPEIVYCEQCYNSEVV